MAATSNDDVDALVMEVAEAELRLEDIAEWLRAPSTDIRHQSAPGDLALIGERNGAATEWVEARRRLGRYRSLLSAGALR